MVTMEEGGGSKRLEKKKQGRRAALKTRCELPLPSTLTRVQRILQQFLQGGRRPLHHLPRGNAVDDVRVQAEDGAWRAEGRRARPCVGGHGCSRVCALVSPWGGGVSLGACACVPQQEVGRVRGVGRRKEERGRSPCPVLLKKKNDAPLSSP